MGMNNNKKVRTFEFNDKTIQACAFEIQTRGTAFAAKTPFCLELRRSHARFYHESSFESRLGSMERCERFLESVLHIAHNRKESHLHSVTLNQFSDYLPHELPVSREFKTPLHEQLVESGLYEVVSDKNYLALEFENRKSAKLIEFMHVLRPKERDSVITKDYTRQPAARIRRTLKDKDTSSQRHKQHEKKHHKQSLVLHEKPKHVTIDYPSSSMSQSTSRDQISGDTKHPEINVDFPGNTKANSSGALKDPFLKALVIGNEDAHILDGQEVWLEKRTSPDGGGASLDQGTEIGALIDEPDIDASESNAATSDGRVQARTKIETKIADNLEHAQAWFTTVKASSEEFDKQVDWSLTYFDNAHHNISNPDGVSVVHKPMDQGPCGSCWAIAATGTLEASIVRREGLNAFAASIRKNMLDMAQTLTYKNMSEMKEEATVAAQKAEQLALIKADLSVQELVDCDLPVVGIEDSDGAGTKTDVNSQPVGDQGCNGGNPILAFFFIHKYGLTSTEIYPYVYNKNRTIPSPQITIPISPSSFIQEVLGNHNDAKRKETQDVAPQQMMCNFEALAQPVASVQSWGILTPNYEDNMELVLRYIGPVAVGIYGAHPSFLAYQQGIFDVEDCPQYPNHALLIVGFGEEEIYHSEPQIGSNGNRDNGSNTQVVRFWLARNSWGESWGENGYVRIRRNDGQRGSKSTCGISQNPSVALGGYFLEPGDPASQLAGFRVTATSSNEGPLEQDLSNNNRHDVPPGQTGTLRWDCAGLGFGEDSLCVNLGG